MTQIQEITLRQPDDWHLHVRDGALMKGVLADTAAMFARAIVMPNLKPPVTTVADARDYRARILEACPEDRAFEPLMTLYLTEVMSPDEIFKAKASGFIHAVKLYPAGATTHSDAGVRDLIHCTDVLKAMEDAEMPLLVHAEVTDPSVDLFDREAVFLSTVLLPALERHPRLKVVVEHMTTRDAADFVEHGEDRVAATITAHHLLYNRNAIFQGGIRPHYYCLPVLKREEHRRALLKAATSGSPRFFLGTDSAPHPRHLKEHACGCAGIYTAHAAMGLYAEAFEEMNALDKIEGFASLYGPRFYGLPVNEARAVLRKTPDLIPPVLTRGGTEIVPLRAGESVSWSFSL